jgi:hypothetical protein
MAKNNRDTHTKSRFVDTVCQNSKSAAAPSKMFSKMKIYPTIESYYIV